MPNCSYTCKTGKKCKNKPVRTNEYGFCCRHQTMLDDGDITASIKNLPLCRFLKSDGTLCKSKATHGKTCTFHNFITNLHNDFERIMSDDVILSHNCNCQFCSISNIRHIPHKIFARKQRSQSADGRMQQSQMGQFQPPMQQMGQFQPPMQQMGKSQMGHSDHQNRMSMTQRIEQLGFNKKPEKFVDLLEKYKQPGDSNKKPLQIRDSLCLSSSPACGLVQEIEDEESQERFSDSQGSFSDDQEPSPPFGLYKS